MNFIDFAKIIDMLRVAIEQVSVWFEEIIDACGAVPLLTFVFFVGCSVVYIIAPFAGRHLRGADSVPKTSSKGQQHIDK